MSKDRLVISGSNNIYSVRFRSFVCNCHSLQSVRDACLQVLSLHFFKENKWFAIYDLQEYLSYLLSKRKNIRDIEQKINSIIKALEL